tara:strand:+ start:6925 stop:8616 length:1692 start_codon:yes stop_codon:yes gene_type:complete
VGLLIGSRLAKSVLNVLPEDLPLQEELNVCLDETSGEVDARDVTEAVHQLLERGARILVVALDSGEGLPERERAVREAITNDFPRHYLGAVPVLCSNQVTLSNSDAVRVNTAVVNAYLHHDMSRVLYRVEDQLRLDGYRYPLLVATADAGTSRVAKTTALRTWGSGPAGGVAGASAYSEKLGLSHVITLDVGGTSSDISTLSDSRWTYRVQPSIANVPVALPAVDIDSIGIGGGSIAEVIDGVLTVGPQSAGAQPGPAAFGLGGDQATVTDAIACLGILDPLHFLGGRKKLDLEAANQIIQEKIAEPLGLSISEAAWEVIDLASNHIAQALLEIMLKTEKKPEDCAIFVIGGAGGYLAHQIALMTNVGSTYVFASNPVFSAFGLSTLAISHSYEARPDPQLGIELQDLRRRAYRDMQGEAIDLERVSLSLEAEFEIPGHPGDIQDVQFGDVTEEISDETVSELVSNGAQLVRLRATESISALPLPSSPSGSLSLESNRIIKWKTGESSTPVFDWDQAPRGTEVRGPAILESVDSTLVVPPLVTLTIGDNGEAVFGQGEGGENS